jgi:hypothetical protein
MRNNVHTDRRGITLMEVLISIGILAVGLTSVMSLIPAGKAEVSRALIYDRASSLAANALADAATFGLLKTDSVAGLPASPAMAVFDPSLSSTPAIVPLAQLRKGGVGASGTSATFATGTVAPIMLRMIAQGRDDLVYTLPSDEDSLPLNQFPVGTPGPRSFMGRMSCLLALATTGTSPTATLSSGSFARLSAVVFHNRDLSASSIPVVNGSWDGSSLSGIVPPADRTLRDIVKPGTVLYSPVNRTFHQLAMAAIDSGTNSSAFVTFSGGQPASTGAVLILLDSVGLAEKTVSLEGTGPWSLTQ